jgi:hypothetical protein
VTELLETILAFRAGSIRIDKATHRGNIARLKPLHGRSNLHDTPHDFMAGDAWVRGRHNAVPLVANGVDIRMADTAEQYLDLDVGICRLSTRNGR